MSDGKLNTAILGLNSGGQLLLKASEAVDCLQSLGIQAVIAESFAPIYYRNGINSGFPLITGSVISSGIKSGENIRVNFKTGVIIRIKTGETISVEPFSEVQMQIYQKGDLLWK